MSKSKPQAVKQPKKSPKYSKLASVATKELADKRKALVSAERNLAKAKQRHEELVAEVARLDMFERALKALLDGTEPPTNIRYVYNYPSWVWQPVYQQPYQTPNWTFTNTPSLPGYTTTNTGIWNTGDIGAQAGTFVQYDAGQVTNTGLTGVNSVLTNSIGVATTGALCANTNTNTTFTLSPGDVTVDLSTNAEPLDAEYLDAEQITTNAKALKKHLDATTSS